MVAVLSKRRMSTGWAGLGREREGGGFVIWLTEIP